MQRNKNKTLGIRVYNTLTGKKEPLPRTRAKLLRLFVCGPTVYDHAHIGHARTYIFFDFFAKYLRTRNVTLKYVQNITNVDDKIIKRAAAEKKNPLMLANELTREYLRDMRALRITAVDAYAPATKFIPEIVRQVQTLIRKGYGYEIPGDGWYYDISKFKDYGKLSRRTAAQAEDALSRIDESVEKRNRGDFCLWKFSKAGEPTWKTALGAGRPGWHIEDTAISAHYFGPQYELHGGGMDLKFPHHEAEIAQQEAASGKKPFVKLWMHTGMLTVEGEKMSKSVGNFVSIRSFLARHSPLLLRFAFLAHHYRMPLDYNEKLIADAKKTLEGVSLLLGKIALARRAKRGGTTALDTKPYLQRFHAALEDDMNTPAASAELFSLIGKAQPILWQLSLRSLAALEKELRASFKLFGIIFEKPVLSPRVAKILKEREAFRSRQQFAHSDRLRKELDALGFSLEDTPAGPFVWPHTPRRDI